jgi:hypothetical protein
MVLYSESYQAPSGIVVLLFNDRFTMGRGGGLTLHGILIVNPKILLCPYVVFFQHLKGQRSLWSMQV